MSSLGKWLVLVALILSPLAMRPAMAAAPTHGSARTEHCPKPASSHHEGSTLPGDCTMGCASALPASESSTPATLAVRPLTIEPAPLPTLHGSIAPPATPPPRG